MAGEHKMSQSDAARIQGAQAKSGGDMSSSGFAARAQSAGDRNANQQASGGHTSAGVGQTGAQAQNGKK